MSAIVIRRLRPEDAAEYRALRLDALREAPTTLLSSYEEESVLDIDFFRARIESKTMPNNANFGAFDGERLVGTTALIELPYAKRRHKMLIVGVYVSPEYRRRGICRQMMQTAIAHARMIDGVERVDLSVNASNAPAQALYRSLGFETWGIEPDFMLYDGMYYDEEHMTLKLGVENRL